MDVYIMLLFLSCLGKHHKVKEVLRDQLVRNMPATVKFLNFRTQENLAVIYLKFKQKAQTLGYFVKKMQME